MTSHPTLTTTTDDQPGAPVVEPVELLSLWHGDDGRWELRGELDADHGAIFHTALREAQDALFQRDGVVVSTGRGVGRDRQPLPRHDHRPGAP